LGRRALASFDDAAAQNLAALQKDKALPRRNIGQRRVEFGVQSLTGQRSDDSRNRT
jgi:hypothetical protein